MAALEWETVALGDVLERVKRPVALKPEGMYRTLGVRLRVVGVFEREALAGSKIAAKTLFAVEPDDVIYSRLFAWRGSFGVVGPEHAGCVVSGEFPTFRARESLLPAFFLLWASQPAVWEAAELVSTGTTAGSRNRLKEDDFLALEIDLSPLEEQRRVVEAVAAADAVGHGLADEEASLTALLQSAHTEAFESLPDERRRLADVTDVVSGGTPARDHPEYFGGDIAWVKSGDIVFRDLYETSETITTAGVESSAAKVLPAKTVVVAMYGQGATRGRCAVLQAPMTTNQACAGILPSSDLDERFLFHWVWSQYEALREDSEGTSQPNLSKGVIENLEIPLPPLDQQQEIAAQLDALLDRLVGVQEERARAGKLRPALVDALLSSERRVRERVASVEELVTA